MGYADQTVIVRTDRFKATPAVHEIVNEAVRTWYDNPDAQRGSDNAYGEHYMTEPSSEDAAWMNMDECRKAHGTEDVVIVPIPRGGDIVQTTKNLSVKVDGALADRLRYPRHAYADRQALLKQVEAVTGSRVISVEITKFPARRKAKAAATEGKTTTVYDVMGVASDWREPQVLVSGLATFPEAKTAGVNFAGDPKYDRYVSFSVVARMQRVTKEGAVNKAMAVIERPTPSEATLGLKVTSESVKPGWKADRYAVTFSIHH